MSLPTNGSLEFYPTTCESAIWRFQGMVKKVCYNRSVVGSFPKT